MLVASPTISCPLKTTTEIDWITPLKKYIRSTYGDPDRYTEECTTLNRLRQDMRGAGRDSASGRDLLYRYYGQLELLDLRFPIDENHIKISFTWYDAFTSKQTSQFSLAYEKASIIFNISAVLSCHAAHQNRSEDIGLKTAYHSFQASAGMFTYINENFLHAPSTDLSRDTVKTLIQIMLAQAQEVFLEKQISDGKKPGMLAKLASQAALLYTQAVEGVQENVARGVFEKVWLTLCQVKQHYMSSLSQYYQGLADDVQQAHGTSIARLTLAESQAKDAVRVANSFPHSVPANSNLTSETGSALVELSKRQLTVVQNKLAEFLKDNDFIYHQTVPNEAALTPIPKMPAAKAIPVQELYAGQDMQRIIGPDIFSKIVPMSVTESASLYDEEKAKLVRAETEKAELSNAEMVAALDYLKLPNAIKLLKHGLENKDLDVDDDFRSWCEEMGTECPEGLDRVFESLKSQKKKITEILDSSSRSLDTEESVCEKMRLKYQDSWTQQPSARLTITLRNDIRNYREAIEAAVGSDNQLFSQYRGVREEIEEMWRAGLNGPEDEDELFRNAIDRVRMSSGGSSSGPDSARSGETLLDVDEGEGGKTVLEQIHVVEELLKKLGMIKRERTNLLKDLKEKVMADDISNVLILNRKSAQNQETQIFATELEKFRPYQTRLLQMAHKQSSLMKELTAAYGDLLQDKRIRAEQNKYESLSRQRNSVLSRFKKTHQAFLDITTGLGKARDFYREMKDTVESLEKNVETFVNNRRNEGAQLLAQIENDKGSEAEREHKKLREMVERISVGGAPQAKPRPGPRPAPLASVSMHKPVSTPLGTPSQVPPQRSPPNTPMFPPHNHNTGYYVNPTPPPPPPGPPPVQPGSAGFPPYQYQHSPATTTGQFPGAPRRDSHSLPRRESYNQLPRNQDPRFTIPPQVAPPMARRESHTQVPASPPPNQITHHPYQPSHYSSPPNMFPGQITGYPPHQPYNPSAYGPTSSVPPPPPGPPPLPLANGRQSYSQVPQGYQPPPPPPPPQLQQAQYYGQQQVQQQQQGGDPWAGLSPWKQ